jgi:hypothetical protein
MEPTPSRPGIPRDCVFPTASRLAGRRRRRGGRAKRQRNGARQRTRDPEHGWDSTDSSQNATEIESPRAEEEGHECHEDTLCENETLEKEKDPSHYDEDRGRERFLLGRRRRGSEGGHHERSFRWLDRMAASDLSGDDSCHRSNSFEGSFGRRPNSCRGTWPRARRG